MALSPAVPTKNSKGGVPNPMGPVGLMARGLANLLQGVNKNGGQRCESAQGVSFEATP